MDKGSIEEGVIGVVVVGINDGIVSFIIVAGGVIGVTLGISTHPSGVVIGTQSKNKYHMSLSNHLNNN